MLSFSSFATLPIVKIFEEIYDNGSNSTPYPGQFWLKSAKAENVIERGAHGVCGVSLFLCGIVSLGARCLCFKPTVIGEAKLLVMLRN
jgi:hypothetical protein